VADDLKLKGPVREIGIERDNDRHDSFNITIGITIKTDGRVTYEEAERLSAKFRREYLGKDVEFLAIHIPCPHCDKVLNSETGLKQHVLKVHPEKAELLTPAKVAAKAETPDKGKRGRKAAKPAKRGRHSKSVKAEKAGKTTSTRKPSAAKAGKRHQEPPVEAMPPQKARLKAEPTKPASVHRESVKKATLTPTQKARQLTLA